MYTAREVQCSDVSGERKEVREEKLYWVVYTQLLLAKNNEMSEETVGLKSQKERKMNRSGKEGTTAMGKQSIVQITVLKWYSCIIQGIYYIGTLPGQLLFLDNCGTNVNMSAGIFPVFMGIGSAFGEDKLLYSPLRQRAKAFSPPVFCYPLKITNTQIKWQWNLTKKKWKYTKKPLPHRRSVLNRMFSYGKTKLCFTQVKTTGSKRISMAMSRSDISPETSGCRTSALWYFSLGSKLLSEVFHLFIICFVNWEKEMTFVFLCMAALGSCAAPEGAG